MDYQDSGNVLKLIANIAVNGFDVSMSESERCAVHPEVQLCGKIDIYDLDLLIRHSYGIKGGE